MISLLLIISSPYVSEGNTLRVCQTGSGLGWIERSDQGDLILHLEGTYYDMGFEQGKVLEKEIKIALNSMKGALHHYLPIASYRLLKSVFYKRVYLKEELYIPQEFKDEMRGLSDATGIPLKELETVHSAFYVISCSAASAFGRASKTGELYQTRSLDYPLVFIDPKTKTPIQDLSIITVYKPKDGIPYVTFGWPGFLGSVGGMNAKGICISEMSLASKYENPAGVPQIFRIKQSLSRSQSLNEAVELMTIKPLEGAYNQPYHSYNLFELLQKKP